MDQTACLVKTIDKYAKDQCEEGVLPIFTWLAGASEKRSGLKSQSAECHRMPKFDLLKAAGLKTATVPSKKWRVVSHRFPPSFVVVMPLVPATG